MNSSEIVESFSRMIDEKRGPTEQEVKLIYDSLPNLKKEEYSNFLNGLSDIIQKFTTSISKNGIEH